LTRPHVKKLEFREAELQRSPEVQPGLREFLEDVKLSVGITDEETAFLKSLAFNGKRPSLLYYYRELQNLRDPLNFLALSIKERREMEEREPATRRNRRKR